MQNQNREPSPAAKALAEKLYVAAMKDGTEQREAVLAAADLYSTASVDEILWAERYVRSCVVAQSLAAVSP